MINSVKDGIVSALVAEFPNIPVFDEPVEQGIVEPSFSVRCVKPMQRLFRGERYYQEDLFEVVYFPPVESRYQSSNETIERLFNCLEILNLPDGKIRGRDMKAYTAEDFTVVFTVKYSDFLYKREEKDMMQTLTQIHRTHGKVPYLVYPLLSDESQEVLTEENAILMIDNEQVYKQP